MQVGWTFLSIEAAGYLIAGIEHFKIRTLQQNLVLTFSSLDPYFVSHRIWLPIAVSRHWYSLCCSSVRRSLISVAVGPMIKFGFSDFCLTSVSFGHSSASSNSVARSLASAI